MRQQGHVHALIKQINTFLFIETQTAKSFHSLHSRLDLLKLQEGNTEISNRPKQSIILLHRTDLCFFSPAGDNNLGIKALNTAAETKIQRKDELLLLLLRQTLCHSVSHRKQEGK